jgi:FKBP-type peptidyl-prolyl cis-trans isomerase
MLSKRTRLIATGITLIAIFGGIGGYIVAGPWLALRGIADAVNSRDADALSSYVDFTSLQQGLTTQLNGAFVRSTTTELKDNPFGGLGIALATSMIDPIVRAWVSPQGIAAMFAGSKPGTTNPQDGELARFQIPDESSYHYDGLSRFILTVPSKDKTLGAFQLIFRRNGLSWRLSGINLPTALFNRTEVGTTSKTSEAPAAAPSLAQPGAAAQAADTSRASNEKFLADNANRTGVKVTADGLQYRVIKAGTGKSPTAPTDNVTVTYKGSLITGQVFDQTEDGKTATFPAGQLIPGWVEALQMMKEGDEWELVIPSNLAYGDTGAGGVIPPNQALVFQMALLRVEP